MAEDKRDELRTLLLDLTPEQMQLYYDFGAACRKALDEARIEFVKDMVAGRIHEHSKVKVDWI